MKNKKNIFELPKTLSSKDMVNATHYENMTNRERDLMFKAYRYTIHKVYELTNPSLLDKPLIEKIRSML